MPEASGLTRPRLFSGALCRRVGDGESAALVAAVFPVGAVERLEECFLLMRVVLVGLGLRQIRDGVVRHHGLLDGWIDERRETPIVGCANGGPTSRPAAGASPFCIRLATAITSTFVSRAPLK